MADTDKQAGALRDVSYYLDKISGVAENKKCVYRGQANVEWPLESGAARQIRQSIALSEKKSDKLPVETLIFSQSDLIKIARNMGFGIQDGRELKDLELLTELQHFAAATCLLDFTENPLVALYMACKDFNGVDGHVEDGHVYVLPDTNLDIASVDTKIEQVINKSSPVKFIPHMHGSAERRIIRQSGVFIIGLDDQQGPFPKVTIPSDDKTNILKELKEKYHISDETLFIDLSGFASSRSAEKLLSNFYTEFYKGLNYYNAANSADKDKAHTLFKKAIDAYTRAIKLKPDFPVAYYNRGVVNADLGRYEDAIADYDEALRLKPDYAEAYNNRGIAKAELERYEDAIADYDEALRLKPDFAEVYFNRGNSKVGLGRYEDAIADYDEALRLKPDHAEAYNNRGIAKAKLERHEALADYDQSLRLKPEDAEAYYNRGTAKAGLGRYEAAIADYDEALRLNPDYAMAYTNRGATKAELGRYEAAIADYDKALRLKPDYAEAYGNRGVAKAGLGRRDEARADYLKAKEFFQQQNRPDDVERVDQLLRGLDNS